jgi:phosphotriesterase-related protein
MSINDVLGVISEDKIGVASLNEYVLYGLPGWDLAPERADYDESVAFAQVVIRLQAFKRAGGSLIVDNSGIAMGRRADFLQSASRTSGIHIVTSTGFPDELGMPGHFYSERFADRKKETYGDQLAKVIANELTLGMVTDGMIRTSIKPSIIRTGYMNWPMTGAEEMCHRAAARASQVTAAAIYSSGNGTDLGAFEMLTTEGAAPNRIVIGHCDNGFAIDAKRDREMAQRGAYVAYDHVGWEDKSIHRAAVSDDLRADLVVELIKAGFKDRILISCGAIGYRLDGMTSAEHGYDYLLTSFVPRLRSCGVSDADIKLILEDNPKRVLHRE